MKQTGAVSRRWQAKRAGVYLHEAGSLPISCITLIGGCWSLTPYPRPNTQKPERDA